MNGIHELRDRARTLLADPRGGALTVGVVAFAGGCAAGYGLSVWRARRAESRDQAPPAVSKGQLQLVFDDATEEATALVGQLGDAVEDLKQGAEEWLDEVRNREESRVKHPSNRFHAPVPVNYDATDDGVEQEAEVTTIFAHDDWDYDVEKRSRSREAPYIIHAEEMFNKEEPFEDFSESTITWFDGDNVLVDENEVPIYNPDQVVGKLNFGHGSGDKNVCYVRNESLEHDYEVLLDTGTYEAAVAGLRAEKEIEDDLQHSEPLRMRRMRDY